MTVVLGAGAYGTALAVSLAQNGPVTLWCRDPDYAFEMQRNRENTKRLPDVELPKNLTVTSELEAPAAAEPVLLAVPMQQLRTFLQAHREDLQDAILVACCKGIELGSGLTATQIILQVRPKGVSAILTGPSFAVDVARGLPTALTLACVDDPVGIDLQSRLSTPNMRVYRTTDARGAEYGGALKNVIAIACGAAMGAGLGESARAALMTRGFAEIVRVATSDGASDKTLVGLSGFGDLVLTCTSDKSRNYRYGQSIGRGETFDPSITVEGAATARAMHHLAQSQGFDLPVTSVVCALVEGKLNVHEAMDMLLSRPLKEE